jgi:hypothetical protein
MAEHRDLVLLVGTIAFVKTGGGGESEASCHGRGSAGALDRGESEKL